MSSNSDVFQRKPFKSGDSKVITVTGLPLFSSNETLNMKPMRLNGSDCIILSSYKEISLAEMEEMPNDVSTVDSDSLEHITTRKTPYALAQDLSDIDVPEGKELVLSVRASE